MKKKQLVFKNLLRVCFRSKKTSQQGLYFKNLDLPHLCFCTSVGFVGVHGFSVSPLNAKTNFRLRKGYAGQESLNSNYLQLRFPVSPIPRFIFIHIFPHEELKPIVRHPFPARDNMQ